MTVLRLLPLLAVLGCGAPDPAVAWADYQRQLEGLGYLRTDRAPSDAPFGNAELAEAFRQIMFYDEYVLVDGVFQPGQQPRPLEKRRGPVRYRVVGTGVTEGDRAHLADIADRIQGLTGLDITEVPATARGTDLHIAIADAEERLAFADRLEKSLGSNPLVHELRNDLGGSICIAVPYDNEDAVDTRYFILVPAEVQGRLRRACLEEEFAQAFGPSADSPRARPSIFNDDQEFALFTEHDGWLFRVLYDARLRPGMTEDEAMPLVRRILAELRPQG